MGALASAALSALASVLMGMGRVLLTEKFVKYAVMKGLECLVKSTKSEVDDEFLAKYKELMDKQD